MDNDISFAEALLRKGADLLEGGGNVEERSTLDFLARMLATIAMADGPVVVHTQHGGGRPELFEEAARIAAKEPAGKVAALAEARQSERAVVFEFDGLGRLSGSRVVAAVLRPEDREDLLEAYIAVGRLRHGAVEMTAVPAAVRFDAAALSQTLALIGPVGMASVSAATAALAHASEFTAMHGHDVQDVPPALFDLSWHAFSLSSARTRLGGLASDRGTLRTLH
ncbi:MAG TPA: hypothetical protein VEB64_00925 [Azospirillaceae bacterium]|nr:hypothetical protein [Azospirillaceae bacterium]